MQETKKNCRKVSGRASTLPAQSETTSGVAHDTGLSGAQIREEAHQHEKLDDNVISLGEAVERMLRKI